MFLSSECKTLSEYKNLNFIDGKYKYLLEVCMMWKKENQNRTVPLCLITVVLRTTEYNALIDNNPSQGNLGGKKVECSGSQSTEVSHWEHLKIGDFLYRNRKEKLFLVSVVHYLRSSCLCFLNIASRNSNRTDGNFQMLWFPNF